MNIERKSWNIIPLLLLLVSFFHLLQLIHHRLHIFQPFCFGSNLKMEFLISLIETGEKLNINTKEFSLNFQRISFVFYEKKRLRIQWVGRKGSVNSSVEVTAYSFATEYLLFN